MQQHVKVNDVIKLQVNRMGINGEGIGYYQRLAIFIDKALPGEEIEAEVVKVFENRAIAKIKRIIKKSKDRIEPFCPIYDECGGCQTQHFNYHAMLAQKRDILIKSFDRYLSNYSKNIVDKTIGMDNPMQYRNKASLPVRKIKGKNRFGMFARGSHTFIPIETCGVQHQKVNEVLETLVNLMDQYQFDSYDLKSKKGFINSLVVRISENLQQIQVSLIVVKRLLNPQDFIQSLIDKHPDIVSIFEVLNTETKKQTFFTDKTYKLYGEDMIKENLNEFDYMLKPEAFFQLNTKQAEKFYQTMRSLANIENDEIAIDAFAGIAPVSHYIYQDAKKVYAIELNKDATDSAKLSLKKNNITNVEVIQSDFSKALKKLNGEKIDVMLFDPPRVGLGSEAINLIKTYKPNRLVYGSCNPSTLAKDLNELLPLYELKKVIPIDMFPFTSLVESISLLELKKAL